MKTRKRKVKAGQSGPSEPQLANIRIVDVLSFEEWNEAVETGYDTKSKAYRYPTLNSVSVKQLEGLRNVPSIKHMRAGDVIFFMSEDKHRARALRCEAKNPDVFGVENFAFGKLSPELVLSLWLTDALRQTGNSKILSELAEMTPEGKTKLFRQLSEGARIASKISPAKAS